MKPVKATCYVTKILCCGTTANIDWCIWIHWSYKARTSDLTTSFKHGWRKGAECLQSSFPYVFRVRKTIWELVDSFMHQTFFTWPEVYSAKAISQSSPTTLQKTESCLKERCRIDWKLLILYSPRLHDPMFGVRHSFYNSPLSLSEPLFFGIS